MGLLRVNGQPPRRGLRDGPTAAFAGGPRRTCRAVRRCSLALSLWPAGLGVGWFWSGSQGRGEKRSQQHGGAASLLGFDDDDDATLNFLFSFFYFDILIDC